MSHLRAVPSSIPNVKLPFWMSPWRKHTKPDGAVEHKIDVARTRSDRLRHRVTLTIAQADVEKLTSEERQKMFIERLKEALLLLGVVRGAPRAEDESQLDRGTDGVRREGMDVAEVR